VRGVPGALAMAAAQLCVALQVPCAVIVRDPDGDRVRQFRQVVPDVAVVGQEGGTAAVRKAVGAPPAVVIEPLGGAYLDQDIDLIARGGAIGVLGAHAGATSTFRSDLLFLKGVALYGTPRAPLTEMAELAGMVADGLVTPVVDRVFDLTDVEAALAYCGHPAGIGRVLLGMNGTR
jgi:NADPH2:quinone reductase